MYTELTPKQVKALPLIAAGATAAEVSKTLGISQQRISEWRHDAKFLSALENARREALAEASEYHTHSPRPTYQATLRPVIANGRPPGNRCCVSSSVAARGGFCPSAPPEDRARRFPHRKAALGQEQSVASFR